MGCTFCKCCESVKDLKKDESFGTSGNLKLHETHKSLSVLENLPEVCLTLDYLPVSRASLEQVQVHENSSASENQLVLRQTCESLSVPENLQLSKRYENLRASKSLPGVYHTQDFLGFSNNLPKHIQTHDVLDAALEEKTNLDTSSSHPLGEIYFLAKDLSIENLPENFQAPEIFLYLKACIDLVVRVAVGHTSASRSEKDIIQNFRDEHSTRYGSGVVFKVYSVKNSTDLCSCGVCESSSPKQRIAGKVYVITSSHMVYDQSEAKSTTADFFCDDESDKEDMRTIFGLDVIHGSDLNGWCIIECVSHDKDLTDKLKDVVETEEELGKYIGLLYDEVLRSKLLRRIHVEGDDGRVSGAINEVNKYPEWSLLPHLRVFDEVIQDRGWEIDNLGAAYDVEEGYKALMTEPIWQNLSDTSKEKLNNQKESTCSRESDLNNDDVERRDGSEMAYKRVSGGRYDFGKKFNVSGDNILSIEQLKQPHIVETGCSELGDIWSKKALADEATGEEQRDEASRNADTEVILGGSGDMIYGASFVDYGEVLSDEVSVKFPADVGRQSSLTEDSDEKDTASGKTLTNLSVIVCHPNGHSKQVCIKEPKSNDEVKVSSLEMQCDGQKVFYNLHIPPVSSQHEGIDWSVGDFESEIAGIEVSVLYPDGTNDKCCIWQMDKKVIETKKWLLQHGGIHTPAEHFRMIIKLDETESQVMDDNKEIEYYWDDLCEAHYIYFEQHQPLQPA